MVQEKTLWLQGQLSTYQIPLLKNKPNKNKREAHKTQQSCQHNAHGRPCALFAVSPLLAIIVHIKLKVKFIFSVFCAVSLLPLLSKNQTCVV
eukprot:m.126286 g.126286  ORF g.126286 m.126286 type:complete len:92 (-) comp14688_c0_seq6:385-660(-)